MTGRQVDCTDAQLARLLQTCWTEQRALDPDGIYDEVLWEVNQRAMERGFLTKGDIGSIVFWKRITSQAPWPQKLLLTPEAIVQQVTRAAFEAVHQGDNVPGAGLEARERLRKLPGMGGTGALASALLVAMAPDRMAVWDRRVGHALGRIGRRTKTGEGFYGRYLGTLQDLQRVVRDQPSGMEMSLRDLDLALFWLGGSKARVVLHRD